ncbi:MAG: superoxide dismutase [Candidatus Ryanbacteria bacterium RIFCSPHIGHO2_02_FULL_45_43]|uniref:superoxide dismutase n=1 Tax=Candidatus Ryanbacteria bacterium RIFCSPHIGHO2_01_45_13 TaxID=1802112 RepID=A0A1G2FUI1_9BACT|nr:MAG: superoxide dismutase [Candidatus Ryanbacteria bacterium RIFCSPHIGHO2_01_45_13]OGZ41772.1 MAG: superoxide dismutase [Candidatus Ryanbacteria bacterium RIFCSPHIGHO2_01_FULL_44_130]OGZ48067.1 MAG: superoxide dismutase [Candidatus Ryanbacteria bacterium RIFCSPHIGHO2_02_FULL_45_43]OGZ50200.1 MAG: superoxide dismutase [Candidatus Ryanbacteria bacterium RIFCSPHIGHO2_12_FULL_44_20]OGZ51074.1 MAG: superoxide dismutase [Candidatus Ryanbacteria bacterium RIFCSPLOWO2_01_FULL_44_230]OGZ54312.1 MAG:
MIYEPKDYTSLLGTSGFSDDLLKNHFTLYGGYVANTNKLLDLLKETEPGTPQFAELKRRFGWEFNGMRLHELYFENMSKKPVELGDDSLLYKKMKEVFGSGEGCEKDFKATGAMRGIGWTILAYDKEGDRLFNIWINEHDAGYLAGASPILVMDVFEHAYVLDYGLKRADYIDAFISTIDWSVVENRFGSA